jgi:hypothetical protein
MTDPATRPALPGDPANLAALAPDSANLPALPRDPANLPAPPSEDELAAEAEREERSERWLFVRQVAIIAVLTATVVTHALLA